MTSSCWAYRVSRVQEGWVSRGSSHPTPHAPAVFTTARKVPWLLEFKFNIFKKKNKQGSFLQVADYITFTYKYIQYSVQKPQGWHKRNKYCITKIETLASCFPYQLQYNAISIVMLIFLFFDQYTIFPGKVRLTRTETPLKRVIYFMLLALCVSFGKYFN
jgi:hypothetical protein